MTRRLAPAVPLAVLALAAPAHAASSDLAISQVYGGGGIASTFRDDFICSASRQAPSTIWKAKRAQLLEE